MMAEGCCKCAPQARLAVVWAAICCEAQLAERMMIRRGESDKEWHGNEFVDEMSPHWPYG